MTETRRPYESPTLTRKGANVFPGTMTLTLRNGKELGRDYSCHGCRYHKEPGPLKEIGKCLETGEVKYSHKTSNICPFLISIRTKVYIDPACRDILFDAAEPKESSDSP